MKEIVVVAPVKKPEDIDLFSQKTHCRDYYVYYKKFLNNNFEYVNEFVEAAKRNNCHIFINFKHDITEENLPEIKKMLKFLKTAGIDGIFINSFAILEAIKVFKLPFKVIVDSYFDIHNLSGIDFVNSFHKVDEIIITEEIYLKNIVKIKKYTKLPLAIDADNLPWCAEDIENSGAVDKVVIKGKFANSEEILEGIELVENILAKPKIFKNHKLPFKHVRKSIYQTNHFSGDMVSAEGKNFKFSRNIQTFEWEIKRARVVKEVNFERSEDFKINLRLSELAQLKELEKYIKKIGTNPVSSIEYGEILSTCDLSTSSFNEIIMKVKKFCKKHDIKFQLSTPRILIERDFDRVYEYVKQLLLDSPAPDSLIINNIGYFWAVINDSDINHIPIEIGQGINLLNSLSIKCLNNLAPINAVDFTSFNDMESALRTIKKVKNEIPNLKYTIAGNIRVPTQGLCPLNNDSAIISRLSCKAPCHKGGFALKDPSLKKIYPFTCDGFCRMHMFEDKILEDFDKIEILHKAGVNEFVFDFSALHAKYIPILFNNFFTSKNNK
ncbi:TPA: U32 family peptidase [Candidatus Scatenecus faecavium]|uniref:U32 family peptidase n=1 Tax=Candidatus Scatenecus faecavium TaxID=2840915 RepID=A0A9D1FXF0_9BACT|nr:U32 family peptidase [Candidatus Scatenecus faecavium]